MRIVGVHLEPGGVGWHRCWAWTTAMSEKGHSVWHQVHKESQFDRPGYDDIVKGADVVIAGVMSNMEVFSQMWAGKDLYGYKLVMDVDDRFDITPQYNPAYSEFHKGVGVDRLMKAQMKIADLVTCTTPQLLSWAKGFGCNAVHVPNVIDRRKWENVRWREKPVQFRDDIRIYWAGTAGRWNDLLLLKEPMLRIAKRNPKVKLIFSGFLPSWAADLSMSQALVVKYASFNAYPKIAAWLCADIGVAPLEDNEFNQAKSGIKYLYYGAARIPSVYQRICSYDLVSEDVTGLKAGTGEEWEEKIERLIADRDLRIALAEAAEKDVWSQWDIGQWSGRYERILRELTAIKVPEVAPLVEGVPVEAPCLMSQA